MLRIRFLRVGKKNSPSFRLVVTPRRSATKTGRFLEILGFYNPIRHEKGLKTERIQYWLSQGAQPSDRVRNMLISEGVMEGEKVAVHKRAKAKPDSAESKPDSAKEKNEGAGAEAPSEPAETPLKEAVVEEQPVEIKEEAPAEPEETPKETPEETKEE